MLTEASSSQVTTILINPYLLQNSSMHHLPLYRKANFQPFRVGFRPDPSSIDEFQSTFLLVFQCYNLIENVGVCDTI